MPKTHDRKCVFARRSTTNGSGTARITANSPGTPDIALTRQKIAIFVDGDFWHARGHETHPGEQVTTNKEYWVKHLSRNVERDREVTDTLTEQGWLVLRFWESDIKRNLEACVNTILAYAR